MPKADSPSLIVARFLKSNNYNETLDAFLTEAGLDEDATDTNPNDWTLEQILEEKRQFDASLTFEKTSGDTDQGWHLPAPSKANLPDLPNSSNVLCVTGSKISNKILATRADKSLSQFLGIPPYTFHDNKVGNDSPILSISHLGESFLLTTSMSGQLALRNAVTGTVLAKRRDHLKMAVQVTFASFDSHIIIATAGWDQKILFYLVDPQQLTSSVWYSDNDFFGSPIHTISLSTVPESLLFLHHPDTHALHLIYSRRDSSFLYYHSIIPSPSSTSTSNPNISVTITPTGRQNLAPHSTAWVSFTPSHLTPHPSDTTLVAIATSHQPHMKLIIVRLLFPSPSPSTHNPTAQSALNTAPAAPNTAALASLALQDRESHAIQLFTSTLAPQTPYSTPCVVWRPSARGVFVNGDDGVIRGIDVSSGKVMVLLKGHEIGSKVRSLWAGFLRDQGQDGDGDGEGEGQGGENQGQREREVLVSGGFDRRVIVWDCDVTEESSA